VCFAWNSEQTAIISPYSINLLVFVTEAEIVYCVVQSGSSNQTDKFCPYKVNVMSVVFPASACLLIFGSLEAVLIAQWAQ
jgi:hypothetical protein